MKKLYKNAAEKQAAYLQRKREKEEIAVEAANDEAQYRALNLCSFAEVGFETPAQTWLDEVQIHRSWLRAFRDIGMDEPDVLPGESLRDLARRTWQGLLRSERFGLGVTTDGFDVWFPLFSPSKQHFQIPFDSKRFPGGPLGYRVHDGAKPDWFDTHWVPPADCTGDKPIDLKSLKPLPPMLTKPEPKPKPESCVPPSTVDARPMVTGYETPLEEQNRLIGFGTFGMTRTSHL